MMQQNLLMPAQCKKCGELFDMSFDMKKHSFEEELETELETKFNWNTPKKKLCWECRTS